MFTVIRRITFTVIKSIRTEGGCRYGVHWMNETLNHLKMIEIGSHRLWFSFSSAEVGANGYEFFPFEGWHRRVQEVLFLFLHFYISYWTCYMLRY